MKVFFLKLIYEFHYIYTPLFMTCPIDSWLQKGVLKNNNNWKCSILYGICDGNDNYIYTESFDKLLSLYEFNVFVLGKSGQ